MSTFDLNILSIMDFVVVLTLSNKQGESSPYIRSRRTHQCRASEESTQQWPMETLTPLPSMQSMERFMPWRDLCNKSHNDFHSLKITLKLTVYMCKKAKKCKILINCSILNYSLVKKKERNEKKSLEVKSQQLPSHISPVT